MAITGPITLTSIWRRNSSAESSSTGPATAMPALLTSPVSVSPFSAARTSRAAASTAASSVTSNNSGVKPAPNSAFNRSASACLRTLPNTRNPRPSSNFAVAQPMPVDAPVMTTDCMAQLPIAACRLFRTLIALATPFLCVRPARIFPSPSASPGRTPEIFRWRTGSSASRPRRPLCIFCDTQSASIGLPFSG